VKDQAKADAKAKPKAKSKAKASSRTPTGRELIKQVKEDTVSTALPIVSLSVSVFTPRVADQGELDESSQQNGAIP
jgi:hypothetical protein